MYLRKYHCHDHASVLYVLVDSTVKTDGSRVCSCYGTVATYYINLAVILNALRETAVKDIIL